MKIVAPFLVICAVLAAGAIYYWQDASQSEVRALYYLDRGELRLRHMTKLGLVQRAEADDYSDRVKAWLAGYFRDVNMLKKRPEYTAFTQETAPEAYLNDITAQKDAAAITEQDFADKKEYYDFTKKIFDQMKSGSYEPELTATANGFRMDLFNIRKEELRGNDTVLADFVFWGNPGDITYGGFDTTVCLGPNTYLNKEEAMKSWEEWTKEALEIVKSNIEHQQGNADEVSRANRERPKPLESIHLEGFGGKIDLPLDEEAFVKSLCVKEGRRIIQADTSEPDFIMKQPQQKIADFPPGIVIGYRQLPLVPHHTKYVDMNMTFQLPASGGGMVDTPLEFKNAEFDESWRMEPGRN